MKINLKKDYFDYIEVFLLLLLTIGPYPPVFKVIIYIVLIMYNYKFLKFLIIKKWYIILFLSIIIPMIFDIRNIDNNTPYSLSSFAYLMPFVLGILYVNKYKKEYFFKIIEKIAFFLAFVSIIGMFVLFFYPLIVTKFPTINFYGRNVYTIVIFNAIKDYTNVNLLQRNCGVAFEPGAFQFIVNLGLQLYFLQIKRKSINLKLYRIIVYIFADILTFSTTGIIILFLILLLNSLHSVKKTIMIFLICILLYIPITNSITYQVDKMSTGNLESRFENTVYVMSNYSLHFLGVGSTGYDKLYRQSKNIGSWDTYTNLYLRFGLLFTIIFLCMNLHLFKIDKGIFIVVCFTLLTESIVGPVITIMYFYEK